eukprot:Skav223051  [mRNA]  locus=scaffold1069:310876:311118:- [translate_table: standard]
MYQNQNRSLNPLAAEFKPGQQEHDFSGASTTSETLSLESFPRAADTMPRSNLRKSQINFLIQALDCHVARERDLKAGLEP